MTSWFGAFIGKYDFCTSKMLDTTPQIQTQVCVFGCASIGGHNLCLVLALGLVDRHNVGIKTARFLIRLKWLHHTMNTRSFSKTSLPLLASLLILTGCPDESNNETNNTQNNAQDMSKDIGSDATMDMVNDQSADMPDQKDMMPDLPTIEPYPAPNAWEPNTGPGGPNVTFTDDQMYKACAYLDGGEKDLDHHNLVVMYDGYLLMPWATEASQGGLSFFDFSDPCNPKTIGTTYERTKRESHSIGFSHMGGKWAVVASLKRILDGGIQFWDIADPTNPQWVSHMKLPGFAYPDAYKRVTLSVFWQAPYVYVAGAQNGIYIVDATDPKNPTLVNTYNFDPIMQAGQAQVVGNLLIVTSAGQSRTVLLDISDPANPQPIPGGDFDIQDSTGETVKAYFSSAGNGYIYYARKQNGGGVIIYDIKDPTKPTYVGDYKSDGNGGYVFVKDNLAFVGESNFAIIYDITDYGNIKEVQRLNLIGDLDTATPIGNVVVLSSDDKSEDGQASSVVPFAKAPDTKPPNVTWSWPADKAENLPITSRFGVTFNEMVDVKSAFEGSVRLYKSGMDPNKGRVKGVVSAQENIVNFWPSEPLEPNTEYTFELPANGVVDYNGNATTATFKITVKTGS